ncbi:ABC transporter-like protein, partial [Nosema granulosis]
MSKKVLEVKDVFFDAVNVNKSYRSSHVRLLNGVSVKFESGRVTAIMGSNGSGKSTLVNLIIGRMLRGSKTSGKIIYCGEENRNPEIWAEKTAFLEQKEVYIKSLSVEEYLKYEIKFYRKDLNSNEQEKLLFDVMNKAEIIHKRYETIEDLSGGEIKKAMIADVLLQNAEVIFMDEPTSWLDSWNASVFIKTMKEVAESKNLIIAIIINQPGQELFEQFDDLIFIKPGGNLFYSGPISEVDEFLTKKSLIKPEGMPTVNYLLSLRSSNTDSTIPVEGHTIPNYSITSSEVTYSGLNQIFTGKSFSFTDLFTILKRRFSYGIAENDFGLMFFGKL